MIIPLSEHSRLETDRCQYVLHHRARPVYYTDVDALLRWMRRPDVSAPITDNLQVFVRRLKEGREWIHQALSGPDLLGERGYLLAYGADWRICARGAGGSYQWVAQYRTGSGWSDDSFHPEIAGAMLCTYERRARLIDNSNESDDASFRLVTDALDRLDRETAVTLNKWRFDHLCRPAGGH